MAENKKDGTKALALTATGLSIAAIIASLKNVAKAAPPGDGSTLVILPEEVLQALAILLEQQEKLVNGIVVTNGSLADILEALTGIQPNEERILQPFQHRNETLRRGVPFGILEDSPGKGSLIWAIIDVDDPNTDVSIRIDELVWEFNYNTLLAQGVQQPLFPGAWLSMFNALTGHYCIIFSAGNVEGFRYNQRLIISATFNGATIATLHEARGIKWTYL